MYDSESRTLFDPLDFSDDLFPPPLFSMSASDGATIVTSRVERTPDVEVDDDLNPPLASEDEIHLSSTSLHTIPVIPLLSPETLREHQGLGIEPSTVNRQCTVLKRGLARLLDDIESLAEGLRLPAVVAKHAQSLATRHTHTLKEPHHRSSRTNMGASALSVAFIFAACRQEGVPRSFGEMARLTSTPVRRIYRHLRLITSKEILGNHLLRRARAVDFLPKLCAELGYPYRTERVARQLLLSFGSPDASPVAQASGALWVACQETAGADSVPPSMADIVQASLTNRKTLIKHANLLAAHKETYKYPAGGGMLPVER